MTQALRHTEKEKELRRKMRQLHIYFKDLKETFIKSGGPGGQNVNKVSTCVQLRHVPSGIQVKCQSERSQAMNRFKAMRLLVDKIEKKSKDEKNRTIQKMQKIKRQNRKRPKYLKEEILERKHQQSEKKAARKKIQPRKINDYD